MSEFTDVMEQARRMCEAHGGMCNHRNCLLDNGEACRLAADQDGEDYNELECIIMDWAKEHPESVYPTWADGWKQLFPAAEYVPCPDEYFGVDDRCGHYDSCNQCKASPMPAEIAKKLGIKPITPDKPVPEHDGCKECRYDNLEENDEPCASCKGTANTLEESGARRDYFERCGDEKRYKEVEERIMQWATAHPAPVYPNWNEWYRKNFPDAYRDGKRICPAIFGCKKNCDSETDCDKCRDRPIPADIAAKLGIKPKEAK